MKRRLSILLAVVLIITVTIPTIGFAEQFDKELEEAIKKAKSLFNITEEYDKFDCYVDRYSGKTVFNLNWSDSDNKLGNLYVSIGEDGIVRGYSIYKPYTSQFRPKLPKKSKDEALEKANEFIKKVFPECTDKVVLMDNQEPLNVSSRYYNFRYTRTENNIPFYNNTISVSVDNMTGEVGSYYCNWDADLQFPSTEDIISVEEVKEIFKDKIGLELVYKFKFENENVEPYLVYTVLKSNRLINAKTGEIVNSSTYRAYNGYAQEEKAILKENADTKNLTPEEQKAIEELAELLSEKEAEKTAREFLKLDDSYELRYINLYNDWRFKDEFIWNMSFYTKENEKPTSISISIDGKTGEVRSFYRNISYYENDEVQYDKDEAFKIAKNYIMTIQPEKFNQVEYIEWDNYEVVPLKEQNKPRSYSFRFMRKVDGAYLQDDGFNITIDTIRGEVISYSYSWYEKELPSIENIISIDEAYSVLFNDIGMELQYITDYPYGYYYEYGMLEADLEKETILVYSIKDKKPLNIDADTGKLLYSNGDVYKERSIVEYTDIDNSFAKEHIRILADFGISLPGSEFKPKDDIKQVEFLYLLAKGKGYYLNMEIGDEKFEDELYNWLIREGVVKENEKSPDLLITREEAVKFIIRVLKYDKVADIKDIFTIPFKDVEKINPNLKGYVAIAYGLGIVNGTDGYFAPQDNLTREQAAIVIYNYLNVEQ